MGNRKSTKQKRQSNHANEERLEKKTKKLPVKCHDKMSFDSLNDITWYTQNPQVAKDAASIQYSNASGLTVDYTRSYALDGSGGETAMPFKIPGIMKFEYAPTVGVSENGDSPVNIAARLIYTYIRHYNSGSRNYETADYMMYLLTVGSLHTYYAELVRVYGLLNTYSIKNRYIADALIKALGYDPIDLRKNMAALRYYINQFAVKVNTFAVPNDMYYFDRNAFIPLHVFKDSAVDKAQLYAFVPAFWYKFEGFTSDTGSQLTPLARSANMTYDLIRSKGDELINSLLINEDIGLMSGDTLKAFGAEKIRKLGVLEPEYITTPIYDEGFLAQIHNMTIVGITWGSSNVSAFTVTQNSGNIICKPTFNNGTNVTPNNYILDSGMEFPTPEFNIEATRFTSTYSIDDPDSDTNTMKIESCGTEVVLNVKIYTLPDEPGDALFETGGIPTLNPFSTDDIVTAMLAVDYLLKKNNFDWAPIHVSYTNQGATIAGEIFNYTVVDQPTLSRLHDMCLQSLFNVHGLYLKGI